MVGWGWEEERGVVEGLETVPSSQVLPESPATCKPRPQVGGAGENACGLTVRLPLLPSSSALHPSTQTRQFYVSIQPPVGELMAPVFMSENEFKKEQGERSPRVDGVRLSTAHGGPGELQRPALAEDPQLLQTRRPDTSGRRWAVSAPPAESAGPASQPGEHRQ